MFPPREAPPEPLGEEGEFVEALNEIRALWRRNPLGPAQEAPPPPAGRPGLRVVAGTDHDGPG